MIVGIIILGAAAAGIGKLFRNSEVSTETSNILQMRAVLRDLVGDGNHGFKDMTNALAIQYKAIPTNMMIQGDEKIYNSWGGLVNIGPTDNGESLFIDYYNVPPDACQRLVLALGSSLKRIQINDQPIPENVTLKDLGTRCDAGGKDGNKIAFVSDR